MEGVTPTPALVCMITGSIQEVTADSSATIRIPDDLSLVESCCIPMGCYVL